MESTMEPTMADSQLSAPLEYVSDLLDVRVAIERTVDDPSRAARILIEYLERRVAALVDDGESKHGLMLSGGIDSILVGAVARSLGIDLVAVTFAVDIPQSPKARAELDGAIAAAAHLRFEHHIVQTSIAELRNSAVICADLLKTSDIWEVASAIPIRACFEQFAALGVTGSVLTGSGADALFLGGKALTEPVTNAAAAMEMNLMIEQQVIRNFTRHRLIPDFFERILGSSSDKFIQVFQTVEAWKFSKTLLPGALFSVEGAEDKLCLRMAAELLGVPAELTRNPKDAIQQSSGVVDGLVIAAREYLADLPGSSTYSSPLTEPLDLAMARLFVHTISDEGSTNRWN